MYEACAYYFSILDTQHFQVNSYTDGSSVVANRNPGCLFPVYTTDTHEEATRKRMEGPDTLSNPLPLRCSATGVGEHITFFLST